MFFIIGIIILLLLICIVSFTCTVVHIRKNNKTINAEASKAQILEAEILELNDKRMTLIQEIHQYEDELVNLEQEKDNYEKICKASKMNFINVIEEAYEKAEAAYDEKIQEKIECEQAIVERIESLQHSLQAANQAILREKEAAEKINFYKLQVTPEELSDIEALHKLTHSLYNPNILFKLIWTTYFQKQTTELCNRVFGTTPICGIYKITNLKTQQSYIGQSVDIQNRIKTHIKCGLGINAPATNKLYNVMFQDGVWNFSFELIEECSKEELNKKEKFWIDLYETNSYGLNSTKGGS